MVTITGTWSRDAVEAFLADATIPVRIACRTPGGGLWMLSLWYLLGDGSTAPDGGGVDDPGVELRCATAASAEVVRYLREDPAVAFEVSTNEPPYRGVRGRGSATIEPDREKALLSEPLVRYLGGTDSSLARRLLSADRDEVRIRITPEKLYSWDYTDRMRDTTAESSNG